MKHSATALRNDTTILKFKPPSGERQFERLFAPGGRGPEAPSVREGRRERDGQTQEMVVRRILVPTDFSPASAKAVQQAVAMANQCNAALAILHVIDLNAQAESGPAADLMKRLWEDGSVRMGQLTWSLCGQVEALAMIEEGLPWETIVEKSRDFDLVVLGKSRAKAGWKCFSHRTGQRVIEDAACPVMVVQD